MTHFARVGAPTWRGQVRAACGTWIPSGASVDTPECETCARVAAQDAENDAALGEMFDDPNYGQDFKPVPVDLGPDPVKDYNGHYAKRYGGRR